MPEVHAWLAIVVLFVVLPVLAWPETLRALARLASRLNDWATAHALATEERDGDEEELWLIHRRHELCADLARIEHLLATDSRMSATRQRGNRLAYAQLIESLRRTPDGFEPHSFDPRDVITETGLIKLSGMGPAQQPPTVEVLEIGWRTRRR